MGSVKPMKYMKFLAPAVLAALLVPACASDETPTDDPGSNDDPISTVDDGVDTEVEQGNNAGFEGDEDG